MLELLVKYAQDNNLVTEPGFTQKDVRWAIVFGAEGQFMDVVELGEAGAKNNRGESFPRSPYLTQGELIGGGKGKSRSHFLVDNASVVACYDAKATEGRMKATDAKTVAKHDFFLQLLRDAREAMPDLKALAHGMGSESVMAQVRERLRAKGIKPTENMTLMLRSRLPVESSEWHEWWREFRRTLSDEKACKRRGERSKRGKKSNDQGVSDAARLMRCFATGEAVEPAATHPKIQGLANVGGHHSGDVLMGFDKDAFCSYGLRQSANASVSEEAAAAYRAGLNKLVKETGYKLAGAKVIHWFKNKVLDADDPLPWLIEGAEQEDSAAQERARRLLDSLRSGERADLMGNYFYAATLSGAAGRIMVRDWMEGRFDQLVRNISNWFDDLSIVRRDGTAIANWPKLLAVVGATVRDLNDAPAPFVAKMWRVAVRDEPIPQSALAQAVARTRVDIIEDKALNHARMGLMKAYHVRKYRLKGGDPMKEGLKPYLNQGHPSPAYQCGRLMAVLAQLQWSALGDVGAGVVQRYYAAASSTPALVLGRLTRLSQFHINKLEGGLARWYESKVAGIWGQLRDVVPRALDLEEQSLFALGYYQQLAEMRSKKTENSEEVKGEKTDE
jgi:CRISPR-associated protein Csd1